MHGRIKVSLSLNETGVVLQLNVDAIFGLGVWDLGILCRLLTVVLFAVDAYGQDEVVFMRVYRSFQCQTGMSVDRLGDRNLFYHITPQASGGFVRALCERLFLCLTNGQRAVSQTRVGRLLIVFLRMPRKTTV